METNSPRRNESSSSPQKSLDPNAPVLLEPPALQKQLQAEIAAANAAVAAAAAAASAANSAPRRSHSSSRNLHPDRDHEVSRVRERSPPRRRSSPHRTSPTRGSSPPHQQRVRSTSRGHKEPMTAAGSPPLPEMPRSSSARDPSPSRRPLPRPTGNSPKRSLSVRDQYDRTRDHPHHPHTRSTSKDQLGRYPESSRDRKRYDPDSDIDQRYQYHRHSNSRDRLQHHHHPHSKDRDPTQAHRSSNERQRVRNTSAPTKTYRPPGMKAHSRQQPLPSAPSRHSSSHSHQLTPPERVFLTQSPESSNTSHLTFETESIPDDGSGQGSSEDDDSSIRYHRMDATSTGSPEDDYDHRHHRNQQQRKPKKHRQSKLNRWYENRFPVLSKSNSKLGNSSYLSSDDEERPPATAALRDGLLLAEDDDFLRTRQSIAWMSILVTAAQLLILMLQLTMCGLAPLDINPMIGPMPSAFSEWGGKNAYLMLDDNQWWRLITPSFLHVGVIHLLVNAFCQLEAIALFEREWGSVRWLLVYVISGVGCNAYASYFDPDTISVGSSGTIMGIYGAKLAQVFSHSCFDVTGKEDLSIRLDQLSSILCGFTLVTILSSFTYIDWSGQAGGLATGFLCGMFFFGCNIRGCCTWFWWNLIGILGLAASLAAVLYLFITTSQPMEEIGDACEYFRSLFPENYECQCLWNI